MSPANQLSVVRYLAAPPEDSFRVVFDVERFPEFMSNVTSVEVLSSASNCRVVAWQMSIDDAPLDWTEEIVYDQDNLRTSFRALDGVFARFDGYWQVYPEGAGSRVELFLEYDLGVPEIQDIIGPILKVRLIENLEAMLTCIATRALSR
jgi:ribosome-associated toxin RatA of RatAB toxin-antitoxin module